MLFSSIPFLFYFLPAVILLYFLVPWKLKNAVLLLFSLVFYSWGEPKYVFLMIGTIILFFFCGLGIEKAQQQKFKKLWLCLSVVISIALLAIFKYADFTISSINAMTGTSIPLLRLALPIGISFYTFQCLSYTIDVYRGHTVAQRNIVHFGAYVSLFPQLIAGPIVRYVDVAKELNYRTHSFEQVMDGTRRFLIGLGKKVIIANNLGQLIEIFRDSGEKSVLFYWMYAIAFMLHIYFDFSGYSDMAIGLGRIFGFRFCENFNYPYLSKNITEFWRRWHMSLGTWFRDYVYIPLGGSRVKQCRWILNILIVWMLTGLWHGAAWNFVIWGLLFAVMLLLEKWIPGLKKLPSPLSHLYVLIVVMVSFVLFNAADLKQAVSDIGGLVGIGNLPLCSAETLYYLRSYGRLFIIAIIGATPVVKTAALKLSTGKRTGPIVSALEPVIVLAILVVCAAYLVDGSFNPFLYFRF